MVMVGVAGVVLGVVVVVVVVINLKPWRLYLIYRTRTSKACEL